ncbi:MAG: hypothetical protein TREMPRED_003783, partial [Tremellales sp. Tagirdzhanova-0007]
ADVDGPFGRVFPSSSSSSPHRLDHDRGLHTDIRGMRERETSVKHIAPSEDEEVVDKNDGQGWLGELEGGLPEGLDPTQKVKMKLDVHGSPAENLQRLITDCGVSPHKIAELVQELPPKYFADRIVDEFFSQMNYVRYPIDEKLFRASYEDLYDPNKAVDPGNVRALPLIFIVLALAVRLAPEEWAGDEPTRKLSSLRMYWSSRRSILIATAVQSESLELVVTRLLSAIYLVLIHDRRLTECWSQLGASLRTAQAIGLHRDGSKLGLEQEFQQEVPEYRFFAITGQFKMFNSAMIAGISAIIDPRGPDGHPMRRILTTFLEQNPWHQVRTKDQTTRKEVQIVHTLSRRAVQIYENSFGPDELDAQDKDSVALLLALRQSGDPSNHATAYSRDPPPQADSSIPKPLKPSRSWINSISGMGAETERGIGQSPESSGGHENDQSQRLLDHWLNANTSLAIGSVNGIAPSDISGPSYLPQSTPIPNFGAWQIPTTVPVPSPLPFAVTGWSEHQDLLLRDQSAGADGSESRMHMTDLGGEVAADFGESNDEYWNALIDGESLRFRFYEMRC